MHRKKLLVITLLVLLVLTLVFIFRAGKTKALDKTSNQLTVSILPIKYLVDKITGKQFNIDVMVPQGVNPENYEPTPQQIIMLNNSTLIFTTGLIEFENALLARFDGVTSSKVVNLSQGIALLSGHCSHITTEDQGHSHSHGVDPHIWTSPRALKIMAKNAYNALSREFPDSIHYANNYTDLVELLESTDAEVRRMIDGTSVKLFFIYHPALTYYSNDYDIEQIAIEQEGKEPSAEHLKHIIDRARESKIKRIFLQNEYSRSTIEVISRDIGAEIVEINPLKEDVVDNILDITFKITQK